MDKPIYALSIQQPWAWMICKGLKDIENRDWPMRKTIEAQRVELPLRVYVHAGQRFDNKALLADILSPWTGEALIDEATSDKIDELAKTWRQSAIIGEVTITGCVEFSMSPWFAGKYGFTLADPVLYDKPIPCRGRLGFFTPQFNEAKA